MYRTLQASAAVPLRARTSVWFAISVAGALLIPAGLGAQVPSPLPLVIAQVQPKMVKVYGAGGVRGLEAYQSGFLISGEGHILTAWSYVLDTDAVTAVLDDGRRFQAELIGANPRIEIAVLKIDGAALDFFDLQDSILLQTGDRVLAFSNLYGIAVGNEPSSVLHGYVSAQTQLNARRGVYATTYNGNVYVLDAMTNNAGSAGGALTDHNGNLAGVLGKELRNAQNNIWLNYALPVGDIRSAVADILSGKVRRDEDAAVRKPDQPVTLSLLGLALIPDILHKTPPFVERVRLTSASARAGLRADDLIVMVQAIMVHSCKDVVRELSFIDRLDAVRLTILRDQTLLELELSITDYVPNGD